MSEEEVYISADVETDGPLPGINSLLSFGCAAFTLKSGLISTFERNLELLPGAVPDLATKVEFWDRNPEAWAACRKDVQPIEPSIRAYVAWVKGLPGIPVFVGYPATFDHYFLHYYTIVFTGSDPLGFSALDMRSYMSGMLGTSFKSSSKKNMPKEWFPQGSPHTHVAIEDSKEQGELFMNMLRARLKMG